MAPPPIPQADPRAGYLAQRQEIDAAIGRVLQSGRYILGEEVEGFEVEFAQFLGARRAVGVSSGTDALVLALKALGVGEGDGVVTVSHTAVATVAAIALAGATPVLVDVEPDGFCMDVADLEAVLERPPLRIKAVVPVHLYGQPAAMPEILALAERHGALVLEDASQAHGAALGERRVGRFGAASAFSLYPTKNLGAIGDAGVIVTDDEALANRLVELRQYGWRRRYVSECSGTNARLDELQAAILRVKLTRLEADNARRREIAAAYDRGLAGLPLITPKVRESATHVFHQYVVQLDDRDRVQAALKDRGVGTAVHYPEPVHRQPAYAGRLPVGPSGLRATEAISARILSLPIHPQLSDDEVGRVIAAFRQTV